jgi:hypothetical protein
MNSLHEVSGAKVKNVQLRDGVELLFQIVQADDRSGFVRMLGADATEPDGIRNSCVPDGRGICVASALLMGAEIIAIEALWNHQIDGRGILEGL